MKDTGELIAPNSLRLSQYTVLQLSSIAKTLVSNHTDLSKRMKKDFAMNVVKVLKDRQ